MSWASLTRFGTSALLLAAATVGGAQPDKWPEVRPQYTIDRIKNATVEELVMATYSMPAYKPERLQVPFKTLVELLRKHRPRVKSELLDYLHNARPKNSEYKRTVTALYAALSEPNSTTALIPLLRSKDEHTRNAAADQLAKKPDPKALAPLLDAFFGRGGPSVRAALNALKTYSFATVVPYLRTALRDPASARAATDALGAFGKHAVPDLLALVRSPSQSVSDSAARGLIAVAEPRALGALLDLADKRHPWPLSQQLAGALSKMGPAALQGVLKLADDDRPSMREWAFDALAQIGGATAERRVIEGLSDPDAICRSRASLALASRLPQRARVWATANASSKSVEKRYLAKHMFNTMRDFASAKKVTVPNHYTGGSRNSSVTDLLRFEDFRPNNKEQVRARLERLYATGDQNLRSKVLLALAKIAGADATPFYVRALKDKGVTFVALMALEEAGDKRALPALRKLQVTDHTKELRDRAIANISNPSLRGRY